MLVNKNTLDSAITNFAALSFPKRELSSVSNYCNGVEVDNKDSITSKVTAAGNLDIEKVRRDRSLAKFFKHSKHYARTKASLDILRLNSPPKKNLSDVSSIQIGSTLTGFLNSSTFWADISEMEQDRKRVCSRSCFDATTMLTMKAA